MLFVAACGGGENQSGISTNEKVRQSNSTGQNDANLSSPEGNLQPETGAANISNSTDRVMQRIERLKAEAANTSGKRALPVTPRPAAENSEIVVELKDVARETRTFRSHPTILKLEKFSNGTQLAVIVTLRDGTRVEIPSEAVPSVETVTTAELIRIVETANGRPTQNRRQGVPSDLKKKENQ